MKKPLNHKIDSAPGFLHRKHARALEAAQDLFVVPQPGLIDSLNCGKLGRLIRYLRTGIPGLLIVCCYEYVTR